MTFSNRLNLSSNQSRTVRTRVAALVAAVGLTVAASNSWAANVAKEIYTKASPSFVGVQFVFENEIRRQEVTIAGVVVAEGIVMVPSLAVPQQFPDSQIKEFKIMVPRQEGDHEELEATLLLRDERHQVVLVKVKDLEEKGGAIKKLPAVKFADKKVEVGDTVYSVSLQPKSSGFRTYLNTGTVSVLDRGATPLIKVSGGVGGSGGLVYDAAGDLVGYVQPFAGAYPFLDPRAREATDEASHFVPASEVLPALSPVPSEDKLAPMPFTGIMALNGLTKDLSEVFNLTGKPAVEIGDVVPNTPAAKAGLEKGNVIIAIDGKPIEFADEPEELGGIVAKQISMKKPGDVVKLTVISKAKGAPKDVEVTLTERPKQPNKAERFYAEDLGYTVRELVFVDRYSKKLGEEAKGVVVDFIKPSSTAQTGRLQRGDVVTNINNTPVTDVESFKATYEAFRKDKPKDPIVLQVTREGATQILKIEPPQ